MTYPGDVGTICGLEASVVGAASPVVVVIRSVREVLANPARIRHDADMTESSETREGFSRALRTALEPWSLTVTDQQLGLLFAHYEIMVEANRTTNLTRITEPVEAAVKHYADSLALSLWAQHAGLEDGSVLDVGTGAGFPAVPLAVTHPTWRVCAIDGTRKKIDFLMRAVSELGLTNLESVHAHADHWSTNRRFGVVCTRAVAGLARSLPFVARLAAPGGWFVAFKTPSSDEQERDEADRMAEGCKMIREPCFEYELVAADDRLRRRLVIYRRAAQR